MLSFLRELYLQGWCLCVGHLPMFEFSSIQGRSIQRCIRCQAWKAIAWTETGRDDRTRYQRIRDAVEKAKARIWPEKPW